MADSPIAERRKAQTSHIIKDIAIIISLAVTLLGGVGLFFAVKEDVAVIKNSLKFIEANVQENRADINRYHK